GGAHGGGSGTGGGAGGGPATCTTENAGCKLTATTFGTCCGGLCRDTQNDPAHCSGCGAACTAGATCSGYKCSSPQCTAGTPCASGGVCTPLSPGYNVCLTTSCTAAGSQGKACNAGGSTRGSCCGGTCVPMGTDTNCGGYCNSCGAGSVCYGTSCQAVANCGTATTPVSSMCLPTGQVDGGFGTCCGQSCTKLNTLTDVNNCGGCNLKCPTDMRCVGGNCSPTDGGYNYGCPLSCPSGSSCSQGKCLQDACVGRSQGEKCNQGLNGACCGASCQDLYTSTTNCGTCGKTCSAGQFCDYGVCKPTPTCAPGNTSADCPLGPGKIGHCCGNACVDTTASSDHCSACNAACPVGASCGQNGAQGGNCSLADAGLASCSGSFANSACAPGLTCTGGKCMPQQCPPGATGGVCAFGVGVSGQTGPKAGTCCNGACVDPTQDNKNCGSCGRTCAAGTLCIGDFLSSARCVPKVSGTDCPVSCMSGTSCLGGICTPTSCNFPGAVCSLGTGGGVCCGSFGSQCTNVFSDINNCGGCNIACGAGTSCVDGVCQTATACAQGQNGRYCSTDGGTGQACCPAKGCSDFATDPQNCGRCGNVCATGLTCSAGSCIALTCTAATEKQTCAASGGGTGTCCASSCTQLKTDVNNCGTCNRKCAAGETCSNGTCGVDTCDASNAGAICHTTVSGSITTGLCCGTGCVNTRSDPLNCGNCNRVCPSGASCVNGSCQ
ncbi:MAG: hypothetical protein K1X89_22110, partial [Myxococcaceae bacterium]|nr:hypothetical protein [Myxococcaceae bacterium]